MHITLETDYAIRIVTYLAREKKRCDAKNISANTGVTLRFSLKILRTLVANNLIMSFKGTHGGYELGATFSDVTLCDVMEAIEGPYRLSRCLETDCCTNPNAPHCKAQAVFLAISNDVQQKLKEQKIMNLC